MPRMGSGRDLLYKPSTPTLLPEEGAEDASSAKRTGGKASVVRDLGGTRPATQVQRPAGSTPTDPSKAPAYKAAYFNKDISGVKHVNLGTRSMQALRGAEGASDLRKVVLPPAIGIETPDPATLRGASDLMGLDGSFEPSLESLLGRQGAWAKGQGVTVEMLLRRLAELEAMVEARRLALERMQQGRSPTLAASITLEQARTTQGHALDDVEDVVAQGRTLVERTAAQAFAMHFRIAKALGIKR